MPKVSVVISTYNRPESLKRAIESVQNQTYQDFEMIVVVDGPEEVSTPREVKVIHVEHFGNDTFPKNTGILAATGEYIALLDDDNQFRPDHLQLLVNELDKNPDIDIVYGDRWLNDETGQVQPQVGKYSDWEPGHLMVENYIDTSDVLIRREALMYVGGFDETQKKYIDWNLWVRLEKAGFKFKRVPVVITDYNIGKDSKSVTKLTENEKKFIKNNPGKFINLPDFDPVDCEIRLPFLGEVHEPRVAIFTLTYDRLELTKKSFESLYKTAGYEFDHYVVDNGSQDGTLLYIKNKYPEAIVIENKKNKGISIASNQAINKITDNPTIFKIRKPLTQTSEKQWEVSLDAIKVKYDIIVKVDNDAIFQTEGWLKRMVDIWKTNHQIVMSCYVEGLKDNPGGAPRYHRGMIAGELLGMTNHLGGVCVFASAKAYDNFRWDENDYLHAAQDLAFSQYVTTHGYAMAYLENYSLRHATAEMEAQYPEYYERRKSEKRIKYESNR